jgi:DNA-binding Lrp family transcriptional regulator
MTMALPRNTLNDRLLEEWQRGFPLASRPFAIIADALGAGEADVIEALTRLQASGAMSRVGGVVRPNTLGASTLAAIAAPELAVAQIAEILAAETGVNHVYLRENEVNIWFVVTGPDRCYVDGVLKRLEARTGLRVLDLRLEKAYHIDLGFAMSDGAGQPRHQALRPGGEEDAAFTPQPGDSELVQALTDGLPLSPAPFEAVAARLGRSEADILARLSELVAQGVVPRIGVIVRHRALGWLSNAMVVWDAPSEQADELGARLAKADGVNLCYRRVRHASEWPFNLYCMIHARSREEALGLLERASAEAGLDGLPRRILFSLNCFKQTGALVARPKEAA